MRKFTAIVLAAVLSGVVGSTANAADSYAAFATTKRGQKTITINSAVKQLSQARADALAISRCQKNAKGKRCYVRLRLKNRQCGRLTIWFQDQRRRSKRVCNR